MSASFIVRPSGIFKKFGATFLWALLILILSFLSTEAIDEKSLSHIAGLDKWVHWAMYGILTYIALYQNITGKNQFRQSWIVSLIIAFGCLVEILQEVITVERHFDFLDILVNIIGLLTGYTIFYFLHN